MGLIQWKRPWTSQPQEVVGVDWNNPLSKGLVFLAPLFGGQVNDIAGGKRATVTGAIGQSATRDGIFGLLSGTQYYDYANFGSELTNTTPATIAWMQTPIAGSGYSCIGTLRPSGSSGGFAIAYQHATASGYRFATGPTGGASPVHWDAAGELGGMTDGRSDRFVLRTSSNLYTTTRSDWTLFRGQDSWTGSSASSFGGVGGANRIGRNGASDAPWDGTIGMLAVWNRALSDDEARSYNANPWQLFAPQQIWVTVSAGGGGAPTLTVADLANAHALDNVVLTSSTALVVQDMAHGHALDAPTLSTGTALTVADTQHAHALDNVTLSTTGATSLTVADLAHGHALDGVTLTLGGINLVIAEIMHSHAIGAAVLTLDTYLAVADILHAHTIDNVLVSIPGDTLDLILKILVNRQELNPATGTFTLYDNDGTTVLYTTSAWADAAGTVPYSGGALRRIDALF